MFTASVITLSDKASEGKRTDESGPLIATILKDIDCEVLHYEILPDDKDKIKELLKKHAGNVSLIVTTGGTGLSPRDVTPEATKEVIDFEVPGIAEAMRAFGLTKTNRSMLSRAVAGVRDRTLIINLPGSPKAVEENLRFIVDVLPHALQKLSGDTKECAR